MLQPLQAYLDQLDARLRQVESQVSSSPITKQPSVDAAPKDDAPSSNEDSISLQAFSTFLDTFLPPFQQACAKIPLLKDLCALTTEALEAQRAFLYQSSTMEKPGNVETFQKVGRWVGQ